MIEGGVGRLPLLSPWQLGVARKMARDALCARGEPSFIRYVEAVV